MPKYSMQDRKVKFLDTKILQNRGYSIKEVSSKLGISYVIASRYFRCDTYADYTKLTFNYNFPKGHFSLYKFLKLIKNKVYGR